MWGLVPAHTGNVIPAPTSIPPEPPEGELTWHESVSTLHPLPDLLSATWGLLAHIFQTHGIPQGIVKEGHACLKGLYHPDFA